MRIQPCTPRSATELNALQLESDHLLAQQRGEEDQDIFSCTPRLTTCRMEETKGIDPYLLERSASHHGNELLDLVRARSNGVTVTLERQLSTSSAEERDPSKSSIR